MKKTIYTLAFLSSVSALGAANAATLVDQVSSRVSYEWDATGTCSSDPATGHGTSHFDVKIWDTGKIVATSHNTDTITDDATNRRIGGGSSGFSQSGVFGLPFDGHVMNHFLVTCAGEGKTYVFTCGYNINAEGVVTSSGSCQ